MMDVFAVTPVPNVSVRADSLDYNRFLGLAQSQDDEYLVLGWYRQGLAQSLPLNRGNDTAT